MSKNHIMVLQLLAPLPHGRKCLGFVARDVEFLGSLRVYGGSCLGAPAFLMHGKDACFFVYSCNKTGLMLNDRAASFVLV